MKALVTRITPRGALQAYAMLFSCFIIWASFGTVAGHEAGPHGSAIRWLGLTEIAGALLFTRRSTRLVGLILLLAVFAIASVVELHLGLWPMRFLFYAGSAILVEYLSPLLGATEPPRAADFR